MRHRSIQLIPALLVVSAHASAAVIDFETLPGGTPTDNQSITDEYAALGFTFGLDTDGDGLPDPNDAPSLEQVGSGDPVSGFSNDGLGSLDAATPGFEGLLGNFFLRGGAARWDAQHSLVVTFSELVGAASGDIWDIDGSPSGTEQWRIEAMGKDFLLGDANDVVDSVDSPVGDDLALDGRPWTFSFSRSSADIAALRVEFIGTKTTTPAIGVGFDRFAALVMVPAVAPAGRVVLALSLLGVAAWRRR